MFWRKAYDLRESLSDAELDRLLSALKEQVEEYRYGIRNYPPERMKRHGEPFLSSLEERVSEVARLMEHRANRL